jgi:hypothetical protein
VAGGVHRDGGRIRLERVAHPEAETAAPVDVAGDEKVGLELSPPTIRPCKGVVAVSWKSTSQRVSGVMQYPVLMPCEPFDATYASSAASAVALIAIIHAKTDLICISIFSFRLNYITSRRRKASVKSCKKMKI